MRIIEVILTSGETIKGEVLYEYKDFIVVKLSGDKVAVLKKNVSSNSGVGGAVIKIPDSLGLNNNNGSHKGKSGEK